MNLLGDYGKTLSSAVPVAELVAGLSVPFQYPFHLEDGLLAGSEKGDGENSESENPEDDCTTPVSAAVPNSRVKE